VKTIYIYKKVYFIVYNYFFQNKNNGGISLLYVHTYIGEKRLFYYEQDRNTNTRYINMNVQMHHCLCRIQMWMGMAIKAIGYGYVEKMDSMVSNIFEWGQRPINNFEEQTKSLERKWIRSFDIKTNRIWSFC